MKAGLDSAGTTVDAESLNIRLYVSQEDSLLYSKLNGVRNRNLRTELLRRWAHLGLLLETGKLGMLQVAAGGCPPEIHEAPKAAMLSESSTAIATPTTGPSVVFDQGDLEALFSDDMWAATEHPA